MEEGLTYSPRRMIHGDTQHRLISSHESTATTRPKCVNMTTRAILLITCFFVKASSVENIYSDSGWRPMSNEKVFALQRNLIKTPIQIENGQENSLANVYERNAIKIVRPYPIHQNKESIKAHEAISVRGIERNGRAFEGVTEPSFKEITTKTYIRTNPIRKAKKIAESDVTLLADNSIPKHTNMDESKEIKNKIKSEPKINYEVYESSQEDDTLTKQDDLKPLDTKSYKYERPILETKQSNLTSKLFDILSNYNIRSGDKLPNYALSLRQNSRNSNNKDFIYMHVPIKIPFRYNSQNHYPIDPLLAVFLSNYGHYLPGLYGFQRSYSNLYGYLASNNIHNNNPSGSYKIFSDTDSSH
ncbi:unnamed protein product [Euphydryas editha]|uniref:Uncharacterized protein n=1 Tax=Euphydryas editha TaxID=104508 RepID=A0AAU9TGA2_EUPED|nr:unnamed protein product [Euphydryas editha]